MLCYAVQEAPGKTPNPQKMQPRCSDPCEVEITALKTQILAQKPVPEWPGGDRLPPIDVLAAKQLEIISQKTTTTTKPHGFLSEEHICLKMEFLLP